MKDYDYSGTIAAVNAYMYSHLENGQAFLVYREEKNRLLAIFAFDEKRYTYQDAYEHYTDILSRVFGVEKMIGLDSVKHKIDDIIAENIIEKERRKRVGKKYNTGTMHMIFGGNPGSAKTAVAKLFAGIAREKGILSSGAFVERGGMDLDGLLYVAAIRDAFSAAKGGVLFIDEAYSLCDCYENSFGDEAINTIVQEMENHKDDVIVIFAGYPEPMKQFLDRNPGM